MEVIDVDVKYIHLFILLKYSMLLISDIVIFYVCYLYLILKLKHEAVICQKAFDIP